MIDRINVSPLFIDLGTDFGREYVAVPLLDKVYGKDHMFMFYVPKTCATYVLDCWRIGENLPERFSAFRDIGATSRISDNERLITSVIMERVKHPKMLVLVARNLKSYADVPRG